MKPKSNRKPIQKYFVLTSAEAMKAKLDFLKKKEEKIKATEEKKMKQSEAKEKKLKQRQKKEMKNPSKKSDLKKKKLEKTKTDSHKAKKGRSNSEVVDDCSPEPTVENVENKKLSSRPIENDDACNEEGSFLTLRNNPDLTLNFDKSNIRVGDYVVMKLEKELTKKAKTIKKFEHYIGQIVEDDDNEHERMIKYLKREKNNSYKFVFNIDVLYPFLDDDIVCVLPEPIQNGGTARVSRHLIFPVNLSEFQNLY